MFSRLFAVLATFWASAMPANANEYADFIGVWGTEKQCARAPIIEGGTRLAEPFEITGLWLKQGAVFCGLTWGPVEKRDNGAFTIANARCGEDSVQDYLLGMRFVDEKLTLRWEISLSNGPLQRCVQN